MNCDACRLSWVLHAAGTRIGDVVVGARALAALIEKNTTQKELDLSRARMRSGAEIALALGGAALAGASAAAMRARADNAASEKAVAERAAAAEAPEELRRRATALGFLQMLTSLNVAEDATLKTAVVWCDEQGVTSVSDIVEFDMVDDFVSHLGLKTLPGRRLCSMLQSAPTAALASQSSDPLASPSSPSLQTAATSTINEGAPWDFFMSHKQSESGHPVALITMDLTMAGKKVWLDVNMNDCGTPAMMEGVEHSKTFVLVLSDGYFDSQFCVMELHRAICLEKKIVLCHKQGVNIGAILQRKPSDPEFANIGDKQSVELIVSDAKFRKVAVERLIASA